MTSKEALEAIKSPDRNVRVRALRAVFSEVIPEGADVVLAGLGDTKRRVREVALNSSTPYAGDPRIAERVTAMVTDENEYHRIRDKALFALGVRFPQPNGASQRPKVVIDALMSLAAVERYRRDVLARLMRTPLTPEVEALLNEFVDSGSKRDTD